MWLARMSAYRAGGEPAGPVEGSDGNCTRGGNMARQKGGQKGAQQHAEGQQGEKTHKRLQETLQSGRREPDSAEDKASHDNPGENRLFEDRQQHDEAEKNSEKTRLSRDIDRHHHDREAFQVPGGAERHSAMPKD